MFKVAVSATVMEANYSHNAQTSEVGLQTELLIAMLVLLKYQINIFILFKTSK